VSGKRDKRPIRRVVGISGTPRRGGNTDLLLDKALEGAKSAGAVVEKIALRDLDLEGCRECGGCGKSGICIIRDDMRRVYKSLERSDAIIVASPIFFGSVTAQLKAMIDRFQGWWIARYVLKKRKSLKGGSKGYFISASGASGRKYFRPARTLVRIFFATLGATYSGALFCAGVEDKGAIIKDKGALERAFRLGWTSAR